MGSTKYIMSAGELIRKDNSLCLRKNEKNIYIPVKNVKEIYCLSEVSINSKLLDFLAQNNIVIHFLIIMKDIVEVFIQGINTIVENY